MRWPFLPLILLGISSTLEADLKIKIDLGANYGVQKFEGSAPPPGVYYFDRHKVSKRATLTQNPSTRIYRLSPYRSASQQQLNRIYSRKPISQFKAIAPSKNIPSGFLKEGKIQSPWSKFKIATRGLNSGDIVIDANTGQRFRAP